MLLKVAMKQNSFVKITIRSITRIMKIDRNVCFMMTLICKCIVCFACKWDWIWLIWRIIYILHICFCWGLTIQAFLCIFLISCLSLLNIFWYCHMCLRRSLFISISHPFSISPALSICLSLCVWWSVSCKTYEVEIMAGESDVWRSLGRCFERGVSSCILIRIELLNTRMCTHFLQYSSFAVF